jgi:hypothetical protein
MTQKGLRATPNIARVWKTFGMERLEDRLRSVWFGRPRCTEAGMAIRLCEVVSSRFRDWTVGQQGAWHAAPALQAERRPSRRPAL